MVREICQIVTIDLNLYYTALTVEGLEIAMIKQQKASLISVKSGIFPLITSMRTIPSALNIMMALIVVRYPQMFTLMISQ